MAKKKHSAQNGKTPSISIQTNDDYLALVERRKQERMAAGNVLDLEMPTGAIWKYLPFSVAQFAVSGTLPVQLIADLESVKNNPQQDLSNDDLVKAAVAGLEVTREVMINNLVFPRISLEPKPGCITPEQLDPEDFDYFMKFVMRGAQSTRNSFR